MGWQHCHWNRQQEGQLLGHKQGNSCDGHRRPRAQIRHEGRSRRSFRRRRISPEWVCSTEWICLSSCRSRHSNPAKASKACTKRPCSVREGDEEIGRSSSCKCGSCNSGAVGQAKGERPCCL